MSGVGVELDNTACAYAEDKFFFAAVAAMATETLTLSWYSDDTAGASAYIEGCGTIICSRVYNQKQSWTYRLAGGFV